MLKALARVKQSEKDQCAGPHFASQVERVSDNFYHYLGWGEEAKGTPFHRVEESIFLIESLPYASKSSFSLPTSNLCLCSKLKKGESQSSRTRESTALGPLTPLMELHSRNKSS